jgi:hypothetical protein
MATDSSVQQLLTLAMCLAQCILTTGPTSIGDRDRPIPLISGNAYEPLDWLALVASLSTWVPALAKPPARC